MLAVIPLKSNISLYFNFILLCSSAILVYNILVIKRSITYDTDEYMFVCTVHVPVRVGIVGHHSAIAGRFGIHCGAFTNKIIDTFAKGPTVF